MYELCLDCYPEATPEAGTPLLENVPDDERGQEDVVCVHLGPELLRLQSFRGRFSGARDLAQASTPQEVYGAADGKAPPASQGVTTGERE